MSYVFSRTTKGFYPSHLRARYEAAGSWPNDAVEVSDEVFEAYGLATPPAGKMRGVDANGQPCWVRFGESQGGL